MQNAYVPLNNTSFKHELLTKERKNFTLIKTMKSYFILILTYSEGKKLKLQRGI